jgi:hypothetical protein
MSFVSANDHPTPVSPQDPLYYAPPSVRNKADTPYKAIQQVGSDHLPTTSSGSDKLREEAFANFTCPLEPELICEHGRPRALIAITGGIGAAMAVAAIGAFVFFTVSPKSKSESSELTVSISTPASAAPAQATSEDSEALLQGFMKFQTIQGTENPQHAISEPRPTGPAKEGSEKPQALLEKFIQWQQKQ